MKYYIVYYITKEQGHAYLHRFDCAALNQRDAKSKVKAYADSRGHHAFSICFRAPTYKHTEYFGWDGNRHYDTEVTYNGKTYTRGHCINDLLTQLY